MPLPVPEKGLLNVCSVVFHCVLTVCCGVASAETDTENAGVAEAA